ncbi:MULTISPECIES: ferrous iron transport protein B [unclassified Desulfovibrio]|uniref:ferrous iron transport protein B n=1 Tax=unclassified Desulfovibrio TaxID=2593640 RepID=UPI000F5F3C32|nr:MULTISPECIES: ferrous iron transport protein B [unclassified Desulfovibrio]RRD69202.1 ferrous iron transport protein B [Desulfovibrio sp. OH1209_COT-279]RRD85681.1 ferrous iron transport protein B [Desulfovibrio sp. OH1186_COT-070]
MKQLLTVLAGQPNCGKSTIFNMLTGARQHVANYPGVTVEKKSGVFVESDVRVDLVDLPGTYSLASWSPEEKAARQFIVEENPDQIVAVLDASTLEKSLYLCLQLMEMQRPTLAALNMLDVAAKRKVDVDADALARALGIPVVRVQASKGVGKADLRAAIALGKGVAGDGAPVNYGPLEGSIRRISALLPADGVQGYPARWLAVKLLEDDSLALDILSRLDNAVSIAESVAGEREAFLRDQNEDAVRAIAHARYARAREIASLCSRREAFVSSMTEKVDAVLCHRLLGPLILVAVLFVFYHASVTLGNYMAAQIWPLWGKLEVLAATLLPAQGFLEDPLLTSLGVWVVKSITAVLNYLPIFVIMFALVAILEDSGYMARIAFVLDRVFHRFGLHGQSTLPLILGGVYVGGCAIPGVIATRAIPDERARLATILIVPMMNCLAKVPLYLLLVGAFFSAHAGYAMFFIGTVTLLMGLVMAKLLSMTLLRGKPRAPFIIELPIYHMPSVTGVVRQTFDRIWMFVRKIGSVVVAVAIIVFMLVSFPGLPAERMAHYQREQQSMEDEFGAAVAKTSHADRLSAEDIVPLLLYQESLREAKRGVSQEEADTINARALKEHPVYAAVALRQGKDGKDLAGALRKIDSRRKTLRREMRQEIFENSFLGRAGKALEGVTAGAGFTWRINVALLSALAAKENSAATLGAIYGLDGTSVGEGMAALSGFTPLHALALMLFMALYPPCLPAAIMVKTQAASTGWMLFSILFQMSIGLAVATLVFSGGMWLGLTGFEAMWVFYGLCLLVLLALALVPQRDEFSPPVLRTKITPQ